MQSVKRARSSPDAKGDEQSLERYPRLKTFSFPVEILALPHVLEKIDQWAMPLSDAIAEAAGAGQVERVVELFKDCDCDVSKALVAAATNGHVEVLKVLPFELPIEGETESYDDVWVLTRKLVICATQNGHLDVVKYVFPSLPDEDMYSSELCTSSKLDDYTSDIYGVAKDALKKAATSGHLKVVKFLARKAYTIGCFDGWTQYCGSHDAFSCAIEGGSDEVVDYLLQLHPRRFFWSMTEACEAAVKAGRVELIDRIYKAYPEENCGENLLVALAEGGHKGAVNYLYFSGHDGVELISEAFTRAARFGKTEVVDFLVATGRISSAIFDTALEYAASSGYGNPDTAIFLYNKKLASSEAVARAFERASSIKITKLFYENEHFSDECVNAAFAHAASCYSKREAKILEYLYKIECISSELIDKAFVSAAINGQSGVLEFLRDDPRLVPDAIDRTFVELATRGNQATMRLLHDKLRVSPEALLKAFTIASSSCKGFQVLRDLENYLFFGKGVPKDVKQKALVTAAHRGMASVFKTLSGDKSLNWPLDVLKDALGAARDNYVKAAISSMINAQATEKCH